MALSAMMVVGPSMIGRHVMITTSIPVGVRIKGNCFNPIHG